MDPERESGTIASERHLRSQRVAQFRSALDEGARQFLQTEVIQQEIGTGHGTFVCFVLLLVSGSRKDSALARLDIQTLLCAKREKDKSAKEDAPLMAPLVFHNLDGLFDHCRLCPAWESVIQHLPRHFFLLAKLAIYSPSLNRRSIKRVP